MELGVEDVQNFDGFDPGTIVVGHIVIEVHLHVASRLMMSFPLPSSLSTGV